MTDEYSDGHGGSIPAKLRAAVLDRDGQTCRLCGCWAEHAAIHHIEYRSEGGRNTLDNLITLHWMFEPRCHEVVHADKRLWQPLLLVAALNPAVTGFALRRQLRSADAANVRSRGSSRRSG